MKPHASHLKDLARLFAAVQSEKEAQMLLEDMLTPQEVDSLAERWSLIRELAAGTPQREIAKKLNISISKITRGSRVLKFGTGGFSVLLKRLHVEKAKSAEHPATKAEKESAGGKSQRRWGLFRR
jgi:Trp operon repressor